MARKDRSVLKYTFSDNKSSRERFAAFPSFLFDAQEDVFETFDDIMLKQANGGAGILYALLNSKIDTAVGDN